MPLGIEIGLGTGHIVLDGDLAPLPQSGASCATPKFRSMPIVAKWSPTSATAEHLVLLCFSGIVFLDRIARTRYVDAVCCYRPCSVVCRSVTLVSHAKTAEPIEMPFGFRSRVVHGNHALDWAPDPQW